MKTAEMECVLASWFDYRKNLIVPNVYWGMGPGLHELDLMVLSKAGYVTEVEIKISRSDLKKDLEKPHQHHGGNWIKFLYFAVPEKLEAAAIEFAPERAGILTVAEKDPADWSPRVRRVRDAVKNKAACKMTDRDRYKAARLGALRIWKLKQKLTDLK